MAWRYRENHNPAVVMRYWLRYYLLSFFSVVLVTSLKRCVRGGLCFSSPLITRRSPPPPFLFGLFYYLPPEYPHHIKGLTRAFGLLILYLLPSLHIRPLFPLSPSARCDIYCLLQVHGSWLLMQIEVSARPNR